MSVVKVVVVYSFIYLYRNASSFSKSSSMISAGVKARKTLVSKETDVVCDLRCMQTNYIKIKYLNN
jgi:hypothetical protein